jgi:hydrogenase small subunit
MPKKDLAHALAHKARNVVALGTCAAFGGIPATLDAEATGLQFRGAVPGGLLGEAFRSSRGRPVINLPGCPCHPEVICCTLSLLANDLPIVLNELNAPSDWYSTLVHQGCTRNEYHEFRVEEERFGTPGCLYFHMGCLGPLTWGPCNRTLWGNRNSKTRAGVPCFGCTRPDFPRPWPFFQTRNIEGVPYDLPDGVDRAHFLAYKSLAAAAAPVRLQKRQTRV